MSPLSQQTRSRALTFVVVTAITLLIWIWAAGETRDSATLYARVGFTTPSGRWSVLSTFGTAKYATTTS